MGIISDCFFGTQTIQPGDFPMTIFDAIIMLTLYAFICISQSIQEEEDRKNGIIRPKKKLEFKPVHKVEYVPVWTTITNERNTIDTSFSQLITLDSFSNKPLSILNSTPTPETRPNSPILNLPEPSASPIPPSSPIMQILDHASKSKKYKAYYCPDKKGYFFNN